MNENDSFEVWARVALMGHVELAGRLSKPTEWGGLFQLDIPNGDSFATRLFSSQAVYNIEIVSEAIARAYATQAHQIIAYDAPIVTREEHQAALSRAERENTRLHAQVRELENRLTAVKALPDPNRDNGDVEPPF